MDTSALVSQLDALRSVSETQVDALGSNTQAVTENTSSRSVSGVAQSVASTLGKTALSMMPLVGIFSQLFGGGDQPQTQTAPVKYTPPPSINIDGTTAFSSAAPQSAPAAAVIPTPAAQPSTTILTPSAMQPSNAPAAEPGSAGNDPGAGHGQPVLYGSQPGNRAGGARGDVEHVSVE